MPLSPIRLVRSWIGQLGLRKRLAAIRSDVKHLLPEDVRFVPSDHVGGFDSIYYLTTPAGRFAVMRINNPYFVRKQRTKNNEPVTRTRRSLAPSERIEREWTAYQTLAPLGLAPAPLWRAEDAMICRYAAGQRLIEMMEEGSPNLPHAFAAVFRAISAMHGAGVLHLDLTPNNILYHAPTQDVTLIDFEFVSAPGRTYAEDCEFDWDYFLSTVRRRTTKSVHPRLILDALNSAVSEFSKHHPAATLPAALRTVCQESGGPVTV